jgi:hypothetical protein
MQRWIGRAALPLALLAVLTQWGCASVTFKPAKVTPGPAAKVLEGIPVRAFGVQSCGAGSLSVVLNYLGDPVGFAELDASLPKGRRGGVLTLDLLLAARQRGFDARLVEGSAELVATELATGRPVILMLQVLDAPGGDRDLFHYVVLDGIDPTRNLVRVQWGDEKPVWTSLQQIDHSWRLTRRATLLVAPREANAAAGEPHELRYAVALEAAGRHDEAVALYQRLSDKEPASALVWTNLGNAEARRGRTIEAELAYRQALELEPENTDALNNLAWLLYEQGERLAEAEELARRAVGLAGADAYLALDTLGRILRAEGRCREAVQSLLAAEQQAPAAAQGREQLALELGLAERDCGDSAWRDRLQRLATSGGDPEVLSQARDALAGEGRGPR